MEIVLLAAAGYVVLCTVWPYVNCRRCGGTGRLRAPSGRAFRKCPRCDHGTRERAGHWLFTFLARR